ncbi:hypothetical protein KFE25_001546 [Diacronema lutheri]|uniref:DNA-directed RNA polymerase III subunit RPC6 n=2 Tax=Diacronema lutheri TaxID=2081491 RepID=A0A8J5XBR2_DIALT|nr:hypothetical protein KFE25_001546 [Diacronema lutheri]
MASSLQARLIELLENASGTGVRQADLERQLRESEPGVDLDLSAVVEALNRMLKDGHALVGRLGNGDLVYRRQSTQEATRVQGLSSEERLVLQLIEATGNVGMWTRDIRLRSNLQQTQVPKILKTLELRKLIKAVKSVASKNKKMYMLYDLEPPHEPFYNDEQELDVYFISVLQSHLYDWIAQQERPVTLDDCWKYIRSSRLSIVELRPEDVQMLLRALEYDAMVEPVDVPAPRQASGSKASAGRGGSAGMVTAYKKLHTTGAISRLADIPCTKCPLVAQCEEAHQISATSCEYFTGYLQMVDDW